MLILQADMYAMLLVVFARAEMEEAACSSV